VFYYDGRYIPDTHNGREEPFSAILTPSKTITVHDFVPISGKRVQSENFYLSYFDPCNGTFHFKFKQICGSDYFKPPVRRRPPEDDEVADGSSGGSSGGFGHPPDDSEENQRRQCFEPFIPGICRPFPEDRRLAPSEQELTEDEVILVAENISHDRRKYGFSTYIPQPEGQIPDYYLTQVIKQHLDGGSPESHVGGIVREKVCVQDGSIIQVDRIGNPSYHGLPDIHDPNATQTSWSAQWNVKSYDDCPNQEPDTPGKMTASATLSEPHTTGKFKLDTFQNAWAHKDFFEKTAPHANLVLSKTEDSIQYTKTRYQVRIGADVALPFKTHVIEEFTPEHDPASTPAEKEYRMRNITITTGNKSATYSIDPQSEPDKEGIWRVFLLPVEVKAHQDKDGPQGSAPKYDDSPSTGSATNLFSVWPNEEIILKVKMPPPFDQQANLPANLIQWDVPGHTLADNTLEAPMQWPLNFFNGAANTKEITITIGGVDFKVHVKVQGVGILTEAEGAALVPHAAPIMLAHSFEAKNYTNTTYPLGPKRDAMRHAYWCSLSVSTFPVTAGDVPFISTGHEYDNRYSDKQQAFNSTMDLKNNAVGISVNRQVDGLPDKAAIKQVLEQLYTAGEMYIWEIPPGAASASQGDSEGILIKSDGTRVH
jgi:hypothetical protein